MGLTGSLPRGTSRREKRVGLGTSARAGRGGWVVLDVLVLVGDTVPLYY